MFHFYIILFLFTDLLQGSTNKYHNCSGEVIIPDKAHELHSFTANNTKLEREIKVFKRDLVTVKGDCCFSIYSQPEGAGEFQTFQSEGQDYLQIEVLNSVYVVECISPLIHPVLKFFLIALAIVLCLYFIWSKGKEYLFRRRV